MMPRVPVASGGIKGTRIGTFLCVACGLALANVAIADDPVFGRYAQYRNLSALPGGTFGVDPDGEPTMMGAMGLSTPIAYSLKGGRFATLMGNLSDDKRFRFPTFPTHKDLGLASNGTGAFMGGIDTRVGLLTVGIALLSGTQQNSFTALFTPRQADGRRLTFAAGSEGLFQGILGPVYHTDPYRGISAFGVATYDVGKGVYVSGGWGTSRFSRGFCNASVGLSPKIRFTAEEDGFGMNEGIGADFGTFRAGRRLVHVVGFAGYVQTDRHAFLSLGFTF